MNFADMKSRLSARCRTVGDNKTSEVEKWASQDCYYDSTSAYRIIASLNPVWPDTGGSKGRVVAACKLCELHKRKRDFRRPSPIIGCPLGPKSSAFPASGRYC